jgi:hypothetical protein
MALPRYRWRAFNFQPKAISDFCSSLDEIRCPRALFFHVYFTEPENAQKAQAGTAFFKVAAAVPHTVRFSGNAPETAGEAFGPPAGGVDFFGQGAYNTTNISTEGLSLSGEHGNHGTVPADFSPEENRLPLFRRLPLKIEY